MVQMQTLVGNKVVDKGKAKIIQVDTMLDGGNVGGTPCEQEAGPSTVRTKW